MGEDDLSLACNNDLKHYIKCFFDFYYKQFMTEDEVVDMVKRINVRVSYKCLIMYIVHVRIRHQPALHDRLDP